jgi:hypothetical protein
MEVDRSCCLSVHSICREDIGGHIRNGTRHSVYRHCRSTVAGGRDSLSATNAQKRRGFRGFPGDGGIQQGHTSGLGKRTQGLQRTIRPRIFPGKVRGKQNEGRDTAGSNRLRLATDGGKDYQD